MTSKCYNKFAEKLSKGEDLTEKELQNAIENDGFDVNEKDEDGHTLCMRAAWKGKTDTVKVLKKQGADVNAKDKNDWTACMWAAAYGKTETLKVLKELGANIDAQDDFGYTACMWAARNGKTETLLELVRLGADISIENDARKTLFDYIDDKTKEEVIRLRREYEAAHPDKPKMADDLAKKYLPNVAVKPVFRGPHTAQTEGAKKTANNQGRRMV